MLSWKYKKNISIFQLNISAIKSAFREVHLSLKKFSISKFFSFGQIFRAGRDENRIINFYGLSIWTDRSEHTANIVNTFWNGLTKKIAMNTFSWRKKKKDNYLFGHLSYQRMEKQLQII